MKFAYPLSPSLARTGLLVSALCTALPANAVWNWQLETTNANLFVAASDPVCKVSVLAGSDAAILRSADAGQSWQTVPTPGSSTITAIVFDATHGQFVAVGSNGSILRSSNCGQQWQRAGAPLDKNLNALLSLDAPRGVLLAAGETGTLLRSTDGGERWQPIPTGTNAYIGHLLLHPAGKTLIAGGTQGLLMRSDNAGRNWQVAPRTPKESLSRLAALKSGSVLAAFANGQVLRSVDAGKRWMEVKLPASEKRPVINAIAQAANGQIAAATADGRVLLSADDGQHWQYSSSGSAAFLSGIRATTDNEFVAVGAGGNILRSSAGGTQWAAESLDSQQEFESINRLPGGELIAPGSGGVIARSTDEGRHWQLVRYGSSKYTHVIVGDAAAGISVSDAVAPHPSNLVAAGVEGNLMRSADDGHNWQPIVAPDNVYFFTALYHSGTRAFLVGGSRGQLWRSTDGGKTWKASPFAAEGNIAQLTQLDGGRVIALTADAGILFSDDGGLSWQTSDADKDTIWLAGAEDPQRHVLVAAGREDNLVRSEDDGKHWRKLPAGLGKGIIRLRSLNGVFLACGKEGVILRSADQGKSFQPITLPAPATIWDVATIPGLPGGLLAVGNKGHILRSTDHGLSWQLIPSGSSELLRVIIHDPISNALLITGRGGNLLQSVDLGLTWHAINAPSSSRYAGVWRNPATGSLLFWGDRILRASH